MQWIESVWPSDRGAQLLLVAGSVLAVLVVFALIYLITLRQRLRLPKGTRSRQPRLSLVDAYSLDGKRQLVLVRRDNIEHLVMIGGPNDVLLESHIVRSANAPVAPKERDAAARSVAAVPSSAPPVKPAAPAVAVPARSSGDAVPVAEKPAAAAMVKKPAEAQPLRTVKVETPAPVKAEPAGKAEVAPAPRPAFAAAPQPHTAPLSPPLERVIAKPLPAAAERPAPMIRPVTAPVEAKPAPAPQTQPQEEDIESLEAEMARLLGRSS